MSLERRKIGLGAPLALVFLAACSMRSLPAVTSSGIANRASITGLGGSRESVIYNFTGSPDGAGPIAGVITDAAGAFFGTTIRGGSTGCYGSGCGVVFQLIPHGSGFTEKILYAFRGGEDGAQPFGTLFEDAKGALYGTTRSGGGDASCSISGNIGCGTVFRLDPRGAHYVETIIHAFHGNDGAAPYAGLVGDADGGLYGTTSAGGSHGYGEVFKLTRHSANRYTETILHSFGGYGTSDGNYPNAELLIGAGGSLYGTTEYGGSPSLGVGTVFKLARHGQRYGERILHRFYGGADGAYPLAGLVTDRAGALYGTTQHGGGVSNNCFAGCGTVFKLAPSRGGYIESVLHSFKDGVDGALPQAAVILVHARALYGTTNYGGSGGNGTVYELKRLGNGYAERILYSFPAGSESGAVPYAGLLDRDGAFYGTTFYGGAAGGGTVFKTGRNNVEELNGDAESRKE